MERVNQLTLEWYQSESGELRSRWVVTAEPGPGLPLTAVTLISGGAATPDVPAVDPFPLAS